MKKIILLCILLGSLNLAAQERPEHRANRSSEEMATLGAKRMAIQLGLNDEQQVKLQKIYQERFDEEKQMRADRKQGTDDSNAKIQKEMLERREERSQLSAKYDSKVKEILSAEQYQKYMEIQEKRREGRDKMK